MAAIIRCAAAPNLVLAVLVMALMGHIVAARIRSKCSLGFFEDGDECLPVEWKSLEDRGQRGGRTAEATAEFQPTPGVETIKGRGSGYFTTLIDNSGFVGSVEYRGPFLTVSAAQGKGSDGGVWAYVLEDDNVVAQYAVPFDPIVHTATGGGSWKVAFVHWGKGDESVDVDFSDVVLTLTCMSGDDFKSDDPALASCPVPQTIGGHENDGSCPLGTYKVGDECVKPLWDELSKYALAETDSKPGHFEFAGEGIEDVQFQKGFILQLGKDNYRASVLTLNIEQGSSSNPTVAVVLEDGTPIKMYDLPVNTQVTAGGSGHWSVALLSFYTEKGGKVDLGGVRVSLDCLEGDQFAGSDVVTCPITYTTTTGKGNQANKCAYSKVGFNPWERWNVFALGQDASLVFNGASSEGRIASIGTVTLQASASVHTAVEAFIPLKAARWSISAEKEISVGSDCVVNGKVESKSKVEIEKGASVIDGVQGIAALSADLQAAAAYFIARSQEWKGQGDSALAFTTGTEIRARVQGKVNFINIKKKDLEDAANIVLEGQPTGSLIINVEGDGLVNLNDKLQVWYQPKGDKPAEPAFGRVLVNLYEAEGVLMTSDDKGADNARFVSILAPLADVQWAGAAVRGNLIAKNVNTNAAFLLHPFGTSANRLWSKSSGSPPPKPKVWTQNGAAKWWCLWHVL